MGLHLPPALGALALILALPAAAEPRVQPPLEPGAALRAAQLPPCTYKTDEWTPVGGLEAPLEAGRYDEVEAVLLDFQKSFEENHACENRMLRSFQQGFQGTPEELRKQFDRWVAARPRSWTAYAVRGLYWSGEAYRRRGGELAKNVDDAQHSGMLEAFEHAVGDLERAIALHPTAVVAHGGLMNAYRIMGAQREIDRVWKRAIGIDPLSVHLHDSAAEAFEPWWGGDLAAVAEVVAHARRHVKENPRLIRSYGHRDACEARLLDFQGGKPPGTVERQLALYASALRYAESNSLWHAWRASAYVGGGYYEFALQDAAYALAVDPRAIHFWVIRIRALQGLNRLEEALAVTRAAQKEMDHHWFPWYEGGTLRRMGRYAEAAKPLRAAADHPGISGRTRGQYLADLGEVLVLDRRYAEAEATLRDAVALRSDYAPAWLALGESLWNQNRRAEGAPAFERYLQLSQGDPEQAAMRAHVRNELAEAR